MKIALIASILWVNWIELVSARSTRSLSTAFYDRMFLAVDTLEQSELSRKKKKGSGESGSGSSESGGKSDLIECSCPSGPGTSIRSESLADRKKKKNKGKKSSEECSCEETATEIGVITAAPTSIIAAAPTCDVGEGVEIGQMDDTDMEEASGLAYSRLQSGVLYTINDHGGPNSVIALGESGAKMTDIILEGIKNEDWEDIATTVTEGVSYILVSDTGNNDHDRDDLAILRFQEPDLSSGDEVTIEKADTEVLEVRYDGFSYDCEALAVDEPTGDFYLFTKDRENSISEVYRYPYPQSVDNNPYTLEHVATLPLFWITGADISPDGKTLVLTNKEEGYKYDLTGGSWAQFLAENPEPGCVLRLEEEEQREAITITESGIWTTSECKDNPPCPLFFYPVTV